MESGKAGAWFAEEKNDMKRIAIVVSTIGYHWEELFAACDVFQSGGATLGGPARPMHLFLPGPRTPYYWRNKWKLSGC